MTVAATLTAADAAAREWDVVVVGAGPAGAVAARQSARAGARVLLVDRATFPRRKVCGCCLNGRALAVLGETGLAALPADLGAVPLRRVTVAAAGRTATLPLPGGVSLSREAFDAALIRNAVAVGVEFLPGTGAKPGVVCDGRRTVSIGDRTAAAGVVIAADGLAGGLAESGPAVSRGSRIGAGAVLDESPAWIEPGTIFMATASGGYVGLVRLEGARLDAAAALDAGFVREACGPGLAAARVIRDARWPAIPGLAEARWKGTPPLTRRPRQLAGERWFAVGDAAGYIEPFTGEGMAWALASAVAVAPLAVAAARRWDGRLPAAWAREHARQVGRRQSVCRLVAAGLRSPVLTRAAVRLLAVLPAAAAPVVRALNRPPLPRAQESPA